MKALRKSYLRRSHGDALVEERTNPSCSLTSAFSLSSSSFADARQSSADQAYAPACNSGPLCHPPAPVAEDISALYFKDPQMHTRAVFKFPWNIPQKGSRKRVLESSQAAAGLEGPAPAAPWDASHTASHHAHTPEKSTVRPDIREFVQTHTSLREVNNVTDIFRSVSYFTHFIFFYTF